MSTFAELHALRPYQLGEGVTARAINGERMTLAVVDLAPNAVLPEHKHENEQMGFVIRGSLTMHIGSEMKELHSGETYLIPSHTPHNAAAGPDGATVADVFAPIREEWDGLERIDPTPGDWP